MGAKHVQTNILNPDSEVWLHLFRRGSNGQLRDFRGGGVTGWLGGGVDSNGRCAGFLVAAAACRWGSWVWVRMRTSSAVVG
ncbi:hypothetical protein D8674_014454 [Pyrus ussuriensis x Pyrus communis]|uniref:Uncharacterized protein n=1 Tax=Pyrus ussuriensis x Pyrus communis TaxID=2448454 RepID=A0A5N5GSL6_9ROSA|nr:hypothetical protein D8674_014454 [Pyrus ussuriensis x Pyrus communis]